VTAIDAPRGVSFKRECLGDFWSDALPLFEQNVAETGAVKEFKPMREVYERLEELGLLHVYTIRVGDCLVGYCSIITSEHPHFSETWAKQDALFVSPKYRGLTAVKFMHWVDGQLILKGIKRILRQSTFSKDISRTLERMGYEPIEISYLRSL
jgi:hypothetical protein